MQATTYEPIGVDARHTGPSSGIDPDTGLGWFRRLIPVIRQHRRPLLIGLAGGLVALVMQVAAPAIARAAIDAATEGDRSDLNRWILVLLVIGAGRFASALTYRYSLHRVAWGVETDLRALLYRHLTRLPFSYYDQIGRAHV